MQNCAEQLLQQIPADKGEDGRSIGPLFTLQPFNLTPVTQAPDIHPLDLITPQECP